MRLLWWRRQVCESEPCAEGDSRAAREARFTDAHERVQRLTAKADELVPPLVARMRQNHFAQSLEKAMGLGGRR